MSSNTEQWIGALNEQIADYTNMINVAGPTDTDDEVLTILTDARDQLIRVLQIQHRVILARFYAAQIPGENDRRSIC